jgi:7,8-dihydropterin-6-yl-methyl-4-(beta-D-ribofuranosyl)aminobenzene 5'-phosphate synthase
MIRITLVVDNTARKPGLQTEHGLAVWVQTDAGHVLFDTGQGIALLHNLQALGINPGNADAIALSHGHYDHTGGLAAVLRANSHALVYSHPGARAPRYKVSSQSVAAEGDTAREIGMPQETCAMVERYADRIRYVEGPTEILPGIWLTGPIPRRHPEENLDREPFFLDPRGKQPDPFDDDQALYVTTSKGVVVVLGCAHAGVINTLDYIRELTGRAPVGALIGGMHLRNAGQQRLTWTIARLAGFDPGLIVPVHCTGERAVAALSTAFGARVCKGGAGAVFEF